MAQTEIRSSKSLKTRAPFVPRLAEPPPLSTTRSRMSGRTPSPGCPVPQISYLGTRSLRNLVTRGYFPFAPPGLAHGRERSGYGQPREPGRRSHPGWAFTQICCSVGHIVSSGPAVGRMGSSCWPHRSVPLPLGAGRAGRAAGGLRGGDARVRWPT